MSIKRTKTPTAIKASISFPPYAIITADLWRATRSTYLHNNIAGDVLQDFRVCYAMSVVCLRGDEGEGGAVSAALT